MVTSRISAAVHRLARLFLGAPAMRLTIPQIQELTGLEDDEARIVLEALKDAGLVDEHQAGVFTRA